MSDAKDPQDRQRRNMPAVLGVSGPALPTPPPPGWLSQPLQSAWLGVWASPVARLLDPISDLPAVTRLFRLYTLAERIDARMDAEPDPDGDEPSFHADVSARVKVAAEVRQLEGVLGLSPRSRLALGLALLAGNRGVASLDDATEAADDDT